MTGNVVEMETVNQTEEGKKLTMTMECQMSNLINVRLICVVCMPDK